MKTIQHHIRIYLVLFFVGLLFASSQAQIDFNLADYKNPDYRWQALDFQLGLDGQNTVINYDYDDDFKTKQSNNSFLGNMEASYHALKNSIHYQGVQHYSLYFNANSSKNKRTQGSSNSESVYQNYGQILALDAFSGNRFYNNKRQFFEVNLNFYGRLENDLQKHSDDSENYPFRYKDQIKTYQADLNLPILVGVGRIEEVQDARLAVYILDDLLKAGDLTRDPDKEDILAFASFITETKNQRFFDSRIRKIEEITAVDSFLIARGLKGKSDASYYTLINDNWDNASGPQRSAGRRFSIGLVPNISTYQKGRWYDLRDTLNATTIETQYKDMDQIETYGLDVAAFYNCEKPINLYWQQSVAAQIRYLLMYELNSIEYYEDGTLLLDEKENINSPGGRLSANYSLGYFPNSRTNLTISAYGSLTKSWEKQTIDQEPEFSVDKPSLYGRLSLNCYYYFSPQLRFALNIAESYQNQSYKYGDEAPDGLYGMDFSYFASRIVASFTYSIF